MSGPRKAYGRHFKLGKKATVKEDLKIILQNAVTHEQELGDLKDVFALVEGKKCESPNLAQWQLMNDRLFVGLRSRRPTGGNIFKQWRDWWLSTDSRWKSFVACLVCAVVAIVIMLAAYFAYRFLFAEAEPVGTAWVSSGDVFQVAQLAKTQIIETLSSLF